MSERVKSLPPRRVHDEPLVLGWRLIVAIFAAAFVLRFSYMYLDDLTRGHQGTFARRFIEELTGNLASAVLFFGVVWLERRRPLDGDRWRASLPAHVAGMVLFSVLHTTLLAASRWAIFPMLGMGRYDYGILSIRYFMEAGQDVVSYVSALVFLTLLRVQSRLQREQLHAATLARAASDARLEALSLRLQPHFLFNALNTISSVVYESPAAADAMIGHLGDLLRHALRTGSRPVISVSEELEVLHAYLAIVDARFGDRVECAVEVEPRARSLAVPAFLLQPLVENAVRHGSAVEGETSQVLVRITTHGSALHLVVENDVPLDGAPRAGSGTGLRTTRDRLQLLYGDDQQLIAGPIADTGRYRVSVRLPAQATTQPAIEQWTPAEVSYASVDR